ncbi:DNA ligase 1-like [Zerene cesonia]|uniref:DNA ligase 1-like n=1 Tax=Zerene cesonia TaxID=33412 RepID=UPI0018E4FA9A|nr:DNA ligase 1-like [Zerene cesonia]
MNSLKFVAVTRLVSGFRSVPVCVVNVNNNRFINAPNKLGYLRIENMSQTSIRSFFSATPKKPTKTKKETESNDNSITDENDSPVTNGTEKKAKRIRSDSSGSDSVDDINAYKVNSAEKKNPKRRRIVSSGSESESKSEAEEIKLEKSGKPVKTYDSPKNKKSKAKVVKTESPVKVSPKKETILSTLKSPKVKQEKASPKAKKEALKSPPSSQKKINVSPSCKKSETSEDKENGIKEEKQDATTTITAEVDYNPAKAKYHPINDACWSKGKEVPYLALAKTLEAIEATSARLKMIEILSNYFRSVILLTPEDLLPSIYMCLNRLAPAYHSLELGMAETYIMKAVGQCTGRSLAQMRSAARAAGDLGLVAEQARATQRTMFAPAPLTILTFYSIIMFTGQASVNKKIGKIQSLYVACRYSEARYLIRSLEGKLRIGLAEQSVLQALGAACAASPPAGASAQLDVAATMSAEQFKARVDEFALTIKTTYCECPNYETLVAALLQHGVQALPQHCRLTPGVPLKPMLAHPTRAVADLFTRFENEVFTCEWKYDGERAQIHVPGDDAPRLDQAAIFSRNQENNTSKYPDVIGRLPSLLKDTVKSCVLDCEAVAYDLEKKQILPFQVLSTRKRKDAQESEIKVQVCIFVFDLLYFNGQPLVRLPLQERRQLLRDNFNEVEGAWQLARGRDCSSAEEVQLELGEALRGACEGLMVKALCGERARYDIARRSHNWLKLKKDYLEGCGDSIDAVVIGAYLGRGRRAGLFGGFLLGARDAAADGYQTLCKLGTGFSDDQLRRFTAALRPLALPAAPAYYSYSSGVEPDVWLSAAAVWEVRCADLSLSPAHRAALGLLERDRGVSLRFPRFIREREDKTPEQATTAEQIAEMYLAQDQVKNTTRAAPCEDDFY